MTDSETAIGAAEILAKMVTTDSSVANCILGNIYMGREAVGDEE